MTSECWLTHTRNIAIITNYHITTTTAVWCNDQLLTQIWRTQVGRSSLNQKRWADDVAQLIYWTGPKCFVGQVKWLKSKEYQSSINVTFWDTLLYRTMAQYTGRINQVRVVKWLRLDSFLWQHWIFCKFRSLVVIACVCGYWLNIFRLMWSLRTDTSWTEYTFVRPKYAARTDQCQWSVTYLMSTLLCMKYINY